MPDTDTEEAAPAMSAEDELGAIFDAAQEPEADTSADVSRDEKGRFAAKDATQEGAAGDDETTDQGEAPAGEAETLIEPPVAWSDDLKAKWPSFDRATQDYILGREREAAEAIDQRAAKLKEYEPLNAAIEPLRASLQLQGQAPAQYIGQLVAADQLLRQNPQNGLREIARLYGFDLSQLSQQQQAGEDIDPALAPVFNELNQLKTQFSEYLTSQQQVERHRLMGEMNDFAKDRPHFEEVRQVMGGLMQAGQAADMQTAYDMAVWANPVIRAKMQAEQSAEAEAKRKTESAERAKKAARVSETNLSSKGTANGATAPKFKDREDELGNLYDSIAGAS